MKLEDLYPENRALVVKKIEDTENDYLVAGKGVVTGVVTIPVAAKTGDYITLKAEEDGSLVFSELVQTPAVPDKTTRRQGCHHAERDLCDVN